MKDDQDHQGGLDFCHDGHFVMDRKKSVEDGTGSSRMIVTLWIVRLFSFQLSQY